jgi:hypothetical protein
VVKDGRLLGLLTADNLAEVLMIQQALRQANRAVDFGGRRATLGRAARLGDVVPRTSAPSGATSRQPIE